MPEHDLRSGLPERASLATGSRLAKLPQRRPLRDEWRRGLVEQALLSHRELGYPDGPDTMRSSGAVAEWLGRGLQSLAHQFDSGRRLSAGKSGPLRRPG